MSTKSTDTSTGPKSNTNDDVEARKLVNVLVSVLTSAPRTASELHDQTSRSRVATLCTGPSILMASGEVRRPFAAGPS